MIFLVQSTVVVFCVPPAWGAAYKSFPSETKVTGPPSCQFNSISYAGLFGWRCRVPRTLFLLLSYERVVLSEMSLPPSP